jgi:prepilin-type N-terminal cleavage/methylation domain-containing protein/prepilin-type processing-associated H-X9-DG protein
MIACICASGGLARRRAARGFTLIELLVVIAIIALLLSVLMPAFGNARRQARAVQCAVNLGSVGKAFVIYLVENKGVYPASYVYTRSAYGDVDPFEQPPDHPYGYAHWSWYLYQGGKVKPEAFTCPEILNKGVPRTNPGPQAGDWEGGQVDQRGMTAGSGTTLVDKQAARMAYTANAAIVPRNKFHAGLYSSGEQGWRLNKFVNETRIMQSRAVILATEFHRNWQVAAVQEAGGVLSKSHRPVHAFYNLGSGYNEYAADPEGGFICGDPNDPENYGLRPLKEIEQTPGAIAGTMGLEINAVGRHHPGGDRLGGAANFLYVDGHVERKTILETIKQRQWGEAYYSLTGENTEINPYF